MSVQHGKLYVIPTPVGNLEDMTMRGLRILREASFILAEDTRQTKKLLDYYAIANSLTAYHKFNERQSLTPILDRLQAGQQVALVSDGGTPCISDPGYILIQACVEAGVEVECLPGATAFVPALVMSGFDTSEFVFMGFPPHKKGRETLFKAIAIEPRVVILYESPHRVLKSLEQILQWVGDIRRISISREISKVYAQTVRGTASELLAHFTAHEPRGEFVIVIDKIDV